MIDTRQNMNVSNPGTNPHMKNYLPTGVRATALHVHGVLTCKVMSFKSIMPTSICTLGQNGDRQPSAGVFVNLTLSALRFRR